MNYEFLGNQIRKQRKLKKYTLEQLAEKLDVSTTFIGQIERAKGIPSVETLVKIANTLEISVDSLLFDDLNAAAGHAHFISRVIELTADLSKDERSFVLNFIEIFKDYKDLTKA